MGDPVNLTNLREMIGDDDEMEKKLFKVFISSSETCLAGLNKNISKENAKAWHNQAHAWKGVSLSLGAEKLGDLCEYAQENSDASFEAKTEMLANMKKEYALVEEYLNKL